MPAHLQHHEVALVDVILHISSASIQISNEVLSHSHQQHQYGDGNCQQSSPLSCLSMPTLCHISLTPQHLCVRAGCLPQGWIAPVEVLAVGHTCWFTLCIMQATISMRWNIAWPGYNTSTAVILHPVYPAHCNSSPGSLPAALYRRQDCLPLRDFLNWCFFGHSCSAVTLVFTGCYYNKLQAVTLHCTLYAGFNEGIASVYLTSVAATMTTTK